MLLLPISTESEIGTIKTNKQSFHTLSLIVLILLHLLLSHFWPWVLDGWLADIVRHRKWNRWPPGAAAALYVGRSVSVHKRCNENLLLFYMRSVVNEFPSLPSSSRRPMATIIIIHYNKQYNRTLSFCIRGRGVDSLCWVPVQVSALLGYDTPTQGLMMLMMMPMLIISGTLISATRCSWRVELNQMEMEADTKHIWCHSSFMMAENYPGECPKYAFHGLPLKTFLWIKMAHDLTFCCCSSVNKDNFIVGHSRYWLLIPIYTSLGQLMIFRSTCPVLSRFVRKCWPRENWKTHSGGGMEAAEVNQFTNGLLRHSLWIMFDGKWQKIAKMIDCNRGATRGTLLWQ